MSNRTDVHRPAELVTEDYRYVFASVNDIEGAPGWVVRHGDFGLELSRRIGATDKLGRHTRQCHHCGARLNYFAVLEHIPTGDLIVVGETCLDNRFALATEDFQQLRRQAQLDRERQRIKGLRAAFVEAHPDLAWLDTGEIPEVVAWSGFVHDLSAKLRRYGELSERQIDAVRRTVEKASTPKPPGPTWVEVPEEGRVEVTGKVLSVKTYDSRFGLTVKMLLQVGPDEKAWKLWTTVPQALDIARGDTVSIRVTVERSSDDPTFAWGRRPSPVK